MRIIGSKLSMVQKVSNNAQKQNQVENVAFGKCYRTSTLTDRTLKGLWVGAVLYLAGLAVTPTIEKNIPKFTDNTFTRAFDSLKKIKDVDLLMYLTKSFRP